MNNAQIRDSNTVRVHSKHRITTSHFVLQVSILLFLFCSLYQQFFQ